MLIEIWMSSVSAIVLFFAGVGAISPQPKTQSGGSQFVWSLSFNLPEVQDSS